MHVSGSMVSASYSFVAACGIPILTDWTFVKGSEV